MLSPILNVQMNDPMRSSRFSLLMMFNIGRSIPSIETPAKHFGHLVGTWGLWGRCTEYYAASFHSSKLSGGRGDVGDFVGSISLLSLMKVRSSSITSSRCSFQPVPQRPTSGDLPP